MLPSHPLFEPFENEFEFRWPYDNRRQIIEFHLSNRDVFLRPKDANARFVWHCFARRWRSVNLNEIPSHFQHMVLEKRLRRFLIFNDYQAFLGTRTIILQKGDLAASAIWPDEMAGFRKPHEFLFAPNFILEPPIQRALFDGHSDLNQARQWLDNFDGPWSRIEFHHGTRAELEPLLKALLILFMPTVARTVYFFQRKFKNQLRLSLQQMNRFGERFSNRFPQQLFNLLNTHFKLGFVKRERVHSDIWRHSNAGMLPSFESENNPSFKPRKTRSPFAFEKLAARQNFRIRNQIAVAETLNHVRIHP